MENAEPSVHPLLRESDFRALLGGMSTRKFKALRAAGVIPAPLELGPRVVRWTHADFLDVLGKLPRRESVSEPQTLAQARRARIEAAKRVVASLVPVVLPSKGSEGAQTRATQAQNPSEDCWRLDAPTSGA